MVVALAFAGPLASTGCLVLKKDYDRCVSDAAAYRTAAETRQKADAADRLALEERITLAESATQDRDTKLADLSTSTHNLQAQLDEATAINQQLRSELERLGKDVDKVLAERGTLSKALDDARARLRRRRRRERCSSGTSASASRRSSTLVSSGWRRGAGSWCWT